MTIQGPEGHESPPILSDVTRVAESTSCAACGHGVQPGEQFCERCGTSVPSGTEGRAAGTWVAVVTADPDYFAALAPVGFSYPTTSIPARTIALEHHEVTIGRRTDAHIDLSAPIEDPAASRTHASLLRQPDGSYAVVDLESANGTCVNGDFTPIDPHVLIPVADGDRIHVGAWTTITARAA